MAGHGSTPTHCMLDHRRSRGHDALPAGKLPVDILARLLERYVRSDRRVLVGPSVGEDACVVDMGGVFMVATTDPVTFATDQIGYYAVQVNANDIAVMGARPRWFLAGLLLPEGTAKEEDVDAVFSQMDQACGDLDVVLCGGHTEITPAVSRPIVHGTMFGEVKSERLVRSSGLREGDVILLTKGLAIEATAIIAREKRGLLEGSWPPALIDRCAAYLREPGIGIAREAMIACKAGEVHAMHDPTEGGVATALRELASAAQVGLSIDGPALFVSEESRRLCESFAIDPLGVISSGALLIGLPPAAAEGVCRAIEADGIRCDRIGTVQSADFGLRITYGCDQADLAVFERDEIAKIFGAGWERRTCGLSC